MVKEYYRQAIRNPHKPIKYYKNLVWKIDGVIVIKQTKNTSQLKS